MMNCIKSIAFAVLLLVWSPVTTVWGQTVIERTETIVLPVAPAASHIVESGQSLKVTSNSAIILKPGVHFKEGSQVLLKIGLVNPIVPIDPNDNSDHNWTFSRSYDANGKIINEQKTFFNEIGRPLQYHSRNLSQNRILTSQPIYDSKDMPVLQTLLAPVVGLNYTYRSDFVKNQNNSLYSYKDFDKYSPGLGIEVSKEFDPNPVSNSEEGTLGWYYSNNNTLEKYQDISDHPYSRTLSNSPVSVLQAGIGEALRFGKGKENLSYSVYATNEIDHYLSIRNKFFSEVELGRKPTSIDYNGIMSVNQVANEDPVISIAIGGQNIISAKAGNDLVVDKAVDVFNNPFNFIPILSSQNVTFSDEAYGNIVALHKNSEEELVLENMFLERGLYEVRDVPAGNEVYFKVGLSDISYNFYNQKGQLIANIAPEGVKKLLNGGHNNYSSKENIPFVTLYQYNTQDQLISTTSPDAGRTEYVYRRDGRLRLSQNAKQRIDGRFSYSNYDATGRVIESGEYKPQTGGIVFNINPDLSSGMKDILEDISPTGGLINGIQYDVIKVVYDESDDSHNQIGYVQDLYFMQGGVSTTVRYRQIINNVAALTDLVNKTWYNYNGEGKVDWCIRYNNDIGYKTIDYRYNDLGNITKVVYQRNVVTERFIHYYEYDADQKLKTVYTNLEDNDATKTVQARYSYYLHGPLKRIELADKLQGIDYVYGVDGQLKSINHAYSSSDPGTDGSSNGFAPDVFGMNMEYYPGDYRRIGSGISSIQNGSAAPSYSGMINGLSWQSKKPVSISGLDAPVMNTYTYDRNQQLISSSWGTPDYAANSFTSSGNGNREHNLSYDLHGNLRSLQRTNSSGTDLSNFTYNYAANTNKLSSVPGYADYTYDAIGQLASQIKGGAGMYLDYDASGKVSRIYSDAGKSVVMLSFVYDESGNRIRKQDHRTGSVTYYSYDAGGSLMAIYDNAGSGGAIRLAEQPVYAANRIGIYYRQAGNYQYTLTDHLGNTRVVINRNKLSNGEADVVYYADYYPFGMVLRSGGVEGRYGYQGQYAEKDGETGWNNFDLRNYDAAIGRWLTVDPYGQYYSPYVGMGNNPVSGVDPDGGFSTWLGAKIWAMFNGGGSISKTDEGIYKVSQSTESSVRIVGGWSSGLGPVNISRSYSAPAVRSNFKRDPAYGPWMGPEFAGRTSRTRRTMLKENDYKFFEDAIVFPNKDLENTAAYTLPISGDINGQKINGVIHISPEFYSKFRGKDTKDLLRHEYGHILQRRLLGADRWWINVAGPSLYSAATKGIEHQKSWTEVQANKLSYDYFGQPSDWNKNSYPVTDGIYFK
ncbi:RHS repeat domain-containing protein [Sphingobacterium spiritivorum]|uniref:RHS repeat domain-containing protein n=1 Tax=Sphingobacterium spiritivorum TaxID=258 RepID=UPI003DA2C72B